MQVYRKIKKIMPEKFKNKIALKQWIKFAVAAIVLILFVIWLGNFWWLLLLPVIFDIYVTKFIPFTFWKKTKNPILRSIAEWTDAIVFALVAVYIINTYFFQNYKIPTSSLEKTLLVGDYLFVSKMAYGPRNPITPFSFPLAQHTLPVFNCKSYIEKPQLDYKRLKGFGTVKRNDIVVFNFPTGDTVALKVQNPDYYTLCFIHGKEKVNSDKATFGEIVYRPVDRRENYVKRCVAIPGDILEIKNNQVYINGEKQISISGLQFNYYVQTNGKYISEEVFDDLNISKDDRMMVNAYQDADRMLDFLGFSRNSIGSHNPVYHLPLTAENVAKLKSMAAISDIKIEPEIFGGNTFPLGNKEWTRDNYGPIWMPKKGAKTELNIDNIALYEHIIRNYEGNKLEVKDSLIFINGSPADTYTFKMDYYWMMGDNRHNSADSRYWGFVPEDHIVGQPMFVWLSLDKDKGLFDGKIRFNRFFRSAKK